MARDRPFQSKALGREIALATDFLSAASIALSRFRRPLIQIKGLTVTRTGEPSTSADSSSAITVTDRGQPVTDLQPAHGKWATAC